MRRLKQRHASSCPRATVEVKSNQLFAQPQLRMSRPGSSSDRNLSCGGGFGSRRQRPRLDDDLDQDRSDGENRSCGGSRDESLAPSDGTAHTSAPGDSEESNDEGYGSSDRKERVRRRRARRVAVPAFAGEPRFTGNHSTQFNNRSDVGNIGFFFGNWGLRTQSMEGGVQKNIDAQITKKNQAKSLA